MRIRYSRLKQWVVVGESLLQVDLYKRDEVDEVLASLGVGVLSAQRLVPLRGTLAERTHDLAPIVNSYCLTYCSLCVLDLIIVAHGSPLRT